MEILSNATFSFNAGGTYTVTLVISDNVLGCADTATTDIFIHALPLAAFQSDPDPACVDTAVNFTDISAGSPESWLWRFTANDSSTIQNPSFTFTSTGTFPVYLEVIDSFCGRNNTTVDVNVLPRPTFNLGTNDTLCRSEEITLVAYPGADSYLWSTGETSAAIVFSNAPDTVWATATLDGCSYTDSLEIIEQTTNCSFALVATAFSPNSDGKNDRLNVLTKRVSSYELIIFNRWGQEVYRGTNADQGWDGSFKDELQDIGVFAYVLNWKNLNGEPFVETGNITLIR
jgi:gliding motility-associated-like protein